MDILRLEGVMMDTELEIYKLNLLNNRNEFEVYSLVLKQQLMNFEIDEADRQIETPVKPLRLMIDLDDVLNVHNIERGREGE